MSHNHTIPCTKGNLTVIWFFTYKYAIMAKTVSKHGETVSRNIHALVPMDESVISYTMEIGVVSTYQIYHYQQFECA
jgi:hypothetical protein